MAEPDKAVISYQDQAGKDSTSTVYFTTGLTLAQVGEGLAALAALIDLVTGAIITGIKALVGVDVSGLTDNTATALSDVEELGEFVAVTGANRKVIVNIPALNSTFSVDGTDDLDQTDPDVAAVITMLLDGIAVTGGTIIPCDVDGNDLISLLYARERVRDTGSRA